MAPGKGLRSPKQVKYSEKFLPLVSGHRRWPVICRVAICNKNHLHEAMAPPPLRSGYWGGRPCSWKTWIRLLHWSFKLSTLPRSWFLTLLSESHLSLSRIAQLLHERKTFQWRIQDFPGAPTPKVGVLTFSFCKIFCRKMHKNERIWTPGEGACVPGAPWIGQCFSACKNQTKIGRHFQH